MSKYRNLELEAYEQLKTHLEEYHLLEPLQQYVEDRLEGAGGDSRERMRVMMEIIRFQVYLEAVPEYQVLKDYVEELKREPHPSQKLIKKAA
jgi:hypothetical protein